MTIDPAWSKKCFTILTNEIAPRAKKLNIPISEFMDSSASGYLALLEFQGHITRRELRMILDERVKYINDNLQKDTMEELPQHG
jgi:hypothetical protein